MNPRSYYQEKLNFTLNQALTCIWQACQIRQVECIIVI